MQHILLMISSEAPGDETTVEPARTPIGKPGSPKLQVRDRDKVTEPYRPGWLAGRGPALWRRGQRMGVTVTVKSPTIPRLFVFAVA